MDEAPLDVGGRRLVLMREAACAMADMPAAKRTLDEFERRTRDLAATREWHNAAFQRQHLRNHPELEAAYHAARFPDRTQADRAPRGAKTAREPELVARLAETDAALAAERKGRREAEERADRVRIGNAAELVREFIRQMGLTAKTN